VILPFELRRENLLDKLKKVFTLPAVVAILTSYIEQLTILRN